MRKRNREGSLAAGATILFLALLNIQGMQHKTEHLAYTCDNLQNLGIEGMDILAVTETWESDKSDYESLINSTLRNYLWVGKPHPASGKSKGRPQGQGGVGFCVHKKLMSCCSKATPVEEHEGIMWLQLSTKEGTIYVAVAYSPPFQSKAQESAEHNKLLKALDSSVTNFDKLGTVIIMGDFNSRMPSLTGDHSVSTGNQTKRTPRMLDFITNLGLKVMTNPEQQKQKNHYTYFGTILYDNPIDGKSINDLIMIKEVDGDRLTNYKVHKQVHLGSDHRLVTASITNVSCNNKLVWDKDVKHTVDWHEEAKAKYKENLKKTLSKVETPVKYTRKWVLERSKQIEKAIKEAVKPLNEDKVKGEVRVKGTRTFDYLCRQKDALINKIFGRKNTKTQRAEDMTSVKEINEQLKTKVKVESIREKKPWWNKLRTYFSRKI